MEAIVASPLPANHYRAVFKRHIVKQTQIVLARVQKQATPLLPLSILEQALLILDYSLHLPEAWPNTRKLLLTMVSKLEQAGYRDEWMPYLEQGIRLSQQLDDGEAQAELHLQLGILYQLRSKYEEARLHFEESAKGYESINASFNKARALNRLAYVARMQRRFEEAISLVETVHLSLTEADEERAFGYYVLGLVTLDQRNWQQAVNYSRQAYELWQPANNWRMIGRSLLCRGVALQELKQYSEAINVDEQAITLFERSRDTFFKAIAQMNLGIVYKNLEQPQRALALYLSAERIFRQVQDQYHLGLVTHNMGLSYRKLGQWAKAKAAYQQSIELKQKLGNIALLVDDMDGLALVYLAEGNLEKARSIFQEAMIRLTQIEDDAWYDYLFEMVSKHLQEVGGRINSNE
jgi:tetratricopeptide (TPR) repeat protein